MTHVWATLIAALAVIVALILDSFLGLSHWLAKSPATAAV